MNVLFNVGGSKKGRIENKVVPRLVKKKWSQKAHETWQIDGKSKVLLGNGEQISWMNIGDEATGAHLKIFVVDEKQVEAMDPSSITKKVNQCFKRWGLPKQIKIDNGRPFVHSTSKDVPTKTVLWWVGLGINVIQNKAGCPQQNGIVECLQGTMNSWSNPKGQSSITDLQHRLDRESEFQRNHFKILSRNRKTRIELYPELEGNERKYAPDNFDINRVYKYLALKVYSRPVQFNSCVKIMNRYYYIGNRYKGRKITVTFDPIERCWVFRLSNGTLLKTSPQGVPKEKEIKSFAGEN